VVVRRSEAQSLVEEGFKLRVGVRRREGGCARGEGGAVEGVAG
jgi:hypothetical protein